MPHHSLTFIPPTKVLTSAEAQAGAMALLVGGPRVNVELHVPPQLAQLLTQQKRPLPQPIAGMALIDTGATTTCIDVTAVPSLGLTTTGQIQVQTPAGPAVQSQHPVLIQFPGSVLPSAFVVAIGSQLMNQGLIALLGRDFLVGKSLVYDGVTTRITIAF